MPAEAIMAASAHLNPPTFNSVFEESPPNQHHHHQENDYFAALAQSEKPQHLEYLKNFRVYQCPQFLQHKCTQHRPFTCFNWHFQNQRRRQPIQRADKSFNYSPDIYCNQYDETTGTCKKGDDCPFLHRVTGDTERRYHLRYYKTSACIHETDDNRNCEKNGPHCAFGHGHDDLRAPIFDASAGGGANLGEVEIEERLPKNTEDKWNDAEHVLSHYKTEPCKKQPRFCRQGYACPHYHNNKDRRRNPKKFKYRSTPCPTVKKVGEDWQDPSKCEKGDNCPMCHTRTEQQFHPDIYKSTKCHDMQQTTYCPRGPFCAFAHVEQQDGQDQPEGSIRNRAGTADACFKMARERRRAQLEARKDRNSVSGGGEHSTRRRAESFTAPSRHYDYHRSQAGGGGWTPSNEQRWTPGSPLIAPSQSSVGASFESQKESLSDQMKNGLKIRQQQWPPHPDRDEEAEVIPSGTSPWSPGNPDVFENTDSTDFHLEDIDGKHHNFADEIRRRRTQSASHHYYQQGQHSPPLGVSEYKEWLSPKPNLGRMNTGGKSSPISIGHNTTHRATDQQSPWPKDGSFGSAILRGVYIDSVGNNGSGSNSWSDDRTQQELQIVTKRWQEEQRNSFHIKQQLDYAQQQVHEYRQREQNYLRQIEEHNASAQQLRVDLAKERIMLEIRQSVAGGTRCPVPREKILTMQRQLRQDLELLERAAAQ